jgi:hypothetical protein
MSQMYKGLHVKYRYCCQLLMELEFSRQIFKKCANIKFHENASSESRLVPCLRTGGRTDRHEANSHFFKILRTRLNATRYRSIQPDTSTVCCIYLQVFRKEAKPYCQSIAADLMQLITLSVGLVNLICVEPPPRNPRNALHCTRRI